MRVVDTVLITELVETLVAMLLCLRVKDARLALLRTLAAGLDRVGQVSESHC